MNDLANDKLILLQTRSVVTSRRAARGRRGTTRRRRGRTSTRTSRAARRTWRRSSAASRPSQVRHRVTHLSSDFSLAVTYSDRNIPNSSRSASGGFNGSLCRLCFAKDNDLPEGPCEFGLELPNNNSLAQNVMKTDPLALRGSRPVGRVHQS